MLILNYLRESDSKVLASTEIINYLADIKRRNPGDSCEKEQYYAFYNAYPKD